MKNHVNPTAFWIVSLLASAAIGALFMLLFIMGYFPRVGITLWIAVAVSVVTLGVNLVKLTFIRQEGWPPAEGRLHSFWLGTIVGCVAAIAFSMMALSGFLTAAAKSALMLVFFSGMSFAFEMILLVTYIRNDIKGR